MKNDCSRGKGSDFFWQVQRGDCLVLYLSRSIFWQSDYNTPIPLLPTPSPPSKKKNFQRNKGKTVGSSRKQVLLCALSLGRCSRYEASRVPDQQSVRLWVVMHSFWSQMWHSPRLNSSTCLHWARRNWNLMQSLRCCCCSCCCYRMSTFPITEPIYLGRENSREFRKLKQALWLQD